jgi:hypothetical protein
MVWCLWRWAYGSALEFVYKGLISMHYGGDNEDFCLEFRELLSSVNLKQCIMSWLWLLYSENKPYSAHLYLRVYVTLISSIVSHGDILYIGYIIRALAGNLRTHIS